MRVIITGGGTGGHIYPALAILEGIRQQYPKTEFLYVGKKGGLEEKITAGKDIEFKGIDIMGFPRKISLQSVQFFFKTIKSFFHVRKIIKNFKPDLVIGTGGYVCAPVVFMGALMKYPAFIHEQNVFPGISNKFLSPFVKKIFLTFAGAEKYFYFPNKLIVTGLPVRQEILQQNKKEAQEKLRLDQNFLTVLVMGGSQGAQSINKALLDMREAYADDLGEVQFYHIAGEKNLTKSVVQGEEENYHLVGYQENMAWPLAAADIVIGRAGASFLAEVTARGIPAILIPYPYAAGDHQRYNAHYLAEHNAAFVLEDQKLDGNNLYKIFEKLLHDKELRSRMGMASAHLGESAAMEKIIIALKPYIGKMEAKS